MNDPITDKITELSERKTKLQQLVKLQAEVVKLETKAAVWRGKLAEVAKCACDVVCKALEVPIEVIMSKSREGPVVDARHLSIYLTIKLSHASRHEIAKMFKLDRTAVRYLNRRVENLIATEPKFASRYVELEKQCRSKLN